MNTKINMIIEEELKKKNEALKNETKKIEEEKEKTMELKDKALTVLQKRFSPYIEFVSKVKEITKEELYAILSFEVKGFKCEIMLYEPTKKACGKMYSAYDYKHLKKEKSISLFVDREAPRYYYGTEKYGLILGHFAKPVVDTQFAKYGFFGFYEHELDVKNRSMIDLKFALENQEEIEEKLILELIKIGVLENQKTSEELLKREMLNAQLESLINI